MITKSTHQPTQQERLADFKAKAVYVPELNFVIGNQFHKQFNKGVKL
jgi:hypothetical protein